MAIFGKLISIGLLFVSLASFASVKSNDIPTTNPADIQIRRQAIVGTTKAMINSLFDVFPGTKSNKYQWLETTTQKRGEFIDKTQSESQE